MWQKSIVVLSGLLLLARLFPDSQFVQAVRCSICCCRFEKLQYGKTKAQEEKQESLFYFSSCAFMSNICWFWFLSTTLAPTTIGTLFAAACVDNFTTALRAFLSFDNSAVFNVFFQCSGYSVFPSVD